MAEIRFHDSAVNNIKALALKTEQSSAIAPELYGRYEVKRGLRDNVTGKGVLAGLTDIGNVHSYIIQDEEMVPVPGKLFYRGYDMNAIVDGFLSEDRYGFEETTYLLLFGDLPNKEELADFEDLLAKNRGLPEDFVRDIIMKAPSHDMMNAIARSILTLYSFDPTPDDTSVENVLRQSIQLIANFPLLVVYSYMTYKHYFNGESLVIHTPRPDYSTAQNIMHLLKADYPLFEMESKLLDLALVLHAEHGGGNNSTFVTHVVTSTGTDTYSAIAASLGSLKGPLHGGANLKVMQMFEDIKANVKDWDNEDEILEYLIKMLKKEVFDRKGLIYGIGHAVYTISDPRTEVLKQQSLKLADLKGMGDEMRLYLNVEKIAPRAVEAHRNVTKTVSANVDFYSGLVYTMLDIPPELFTPIFAASRISGWSAHRLEEIVNRGKIIRPAYKAISKRKDYVSLAGR